ncbi:RNA polymerase sigma factor, partial [Sandarakinorhabdus oryzae]|uniref:RNA polymerase sigma factor n=1 Tax=Sandarakinorhabdus oryzae TaxID=2675220 RepID=UPI0012E11585
MASATASPAHAAAEAAARTAYGRLVALLARDTRDIAAAEDALATALARALDHWPADGVPTSPDAWLLTVARRELGHGRARAATAMAAAPALALLDDERADTPDTEFPDERLKLLFVCTHPAITARVQAPLMLQVVLGLDAARIAAAFLVSPAAMGQALVRAKARIRDAGIAFTVPPQDQRPARLAAIRTAIYAAYGAGWDQLEADHPSDLATEALFLARLVATLAPDDAENAGLLALILLCEARRPARRDADGGFVPLDKQDFQLWDREMVREGEAALRHAAAQGQPGRFQLEAAIQSLHNQQRFTGADLSAPLIGLYDRLLDLAPSIGAAIARAAALTAAGAAPAALAAL